ncbi:hypothetical protein [Streptomyces sp. NPDC018610]|uniref:hypothetical protein n=1 Tax=Streptomyces sp. NPDC018610 TaxID=3365049 RepID=UPI003798794F
MAAHAARGMRVLMVAFFLPLFAAASVGFGVWAAHSGEHDSPSGGSLWWLCSICGLLVLVGLIDLVALRRRRRRERLVARSQPGFDAR